MSHLRRIRRRRPTRRAGFTLMEVLLVLAILVVLGSLVVVSIPNIMSGADANSAKVQISGLKTAVSAYYIDIKQYPPDLTALVEQPGNLTVPDRWKGPYLDSSTVPLDPWGRPYQYEVIGKQVRIWSAGEDGAEGTEDDISSDKQV